LNKILPHDVSCVVPLSRDGTSSSLFPSCAVLLSHGGLPVYGQWPAFSGVRNSPVSKFSVSGGSAPRPVFGLYAVSSSVLRPASLWRFLRGPVLSVPPPVSCPVWSASSLLDAPPSFLGRPSSFCLFWLSPRSSFLI
jgi:hypothetical protein